MKQLTTVMFVLVFLISSPYLYAQGVLKGRILFKGVPPVAEQVEVKSDTPVCGQKKEVKKLIVGTEQGIAHAVITLSGPGGPAAAPKEGVLDQVHCEFVPHVQVLPVGSTLKVTSSDVVLHNAHGFYEDGSTAFNLAVPIVGMEVAQKLKQAGVIKLRCDAGHTWMSAYIVVTEKPYYALTDANGNFMLEGIPPGAYEMEVWHEWLGKHRESLNIKEGEQTISVTLEAPPV